MKILRVVSLAMLFPAFLHTPHAAALDIVTNYLGGNPPANAVGGGNIADIVNAAARIWASAYADTATVTIHYGWASLGDAGTHTLIRQGGTPNREIEGIILFDNSGASSFYLDPTPNDNEEYRRRTEEYQNLGGGFVNVARLFSSPTGAAAGHIDLLSVALHEIGHAMGMCAGNAAFVAEAGAGVIGLADGFPYEGTVIPLASTNAGITSHFDATQVTYGALMSGISADERRLPSTLDIVANARISGYEIANPGNQSATRSSPGRGTARSASDVPVSRK